MSRTKSINRAGAVVLLAVGASAAFCFAARAQESEQPSTAFGYEMPKQFLINRMTAPPRPKSDGAGGSAAGQGANGGQGASGGQAADNGDEDVGGYGDQNPFPKRYLLNKMFDFGGGDNAPAAPPATSAPAATASAPAVKSP